MAGGFGTRLRPLTDEMPKPMLPVGDRPLLSASSSSCARPASGASTSPRITSRRRSRPFGDGADFGVELDYVTEDTPLGTAGALGLMERRASRCSSSTATSSPHVNFRAMLAFHREHSADAHGRPCGKYEMQVPYGVVERDGAQVRGAAREAGDLHFLVNAGIYLLEPAVHDYIPAGERFDMTDLIRALLDARPHRGELSRSSNTGSTSGSTPTTSRRRRTSRAGS